MASSTASTIIGHARNIVRGESGSDAPVLSDAFLLTAISDGNLKWARAFQTTGSAPIVFQRETGFDLANETAINDSAGTTTSTTTITVDSTTGYDSSGVAVIWDDNMPDIFAYTSVSATTFVGVTGLAFAHEDNDPIQPMYRLPSTFGAFRKSPSYGDGVRLNGVPFFFMGGPPVPGYFSMYDDGTNKFLWLPRDSTSSASVWFDKSSATIDSTDDTVDVPTEFDWFLVWHCVAFIYQGRTDDANMYQFARAESERLLMEALRNRNIGKKIRTRPMGRPMTDFIAIDGRLVPFL